MTPDELFADMIKRQQRGVDILVGGLMACAVFALVVIFMFLITQLGLL